VEVTGLEGKEDFESRIRKIVEWYVAKYSKCISPTSTSQVGVSFPP